MTVGEGLGERAAALDPCGRRLRRSVRGQSLVEFIIVFPFVFVLFAGIFEFGRYYYARQTQRHAVFEAARLGVTGNVLNDPETGDPMTRAESIRSIIQERADQVNIEVEDLTITPADGGQPGEVVRISSTFRYYFTFPAMTKVFGAVHVDFTITAAMKNEPVFATGT